jgi:hypothetical protein
MDRAAWISLFIVLGIVSYIAVAPGTDAATNHVVQPQPTSLWGTMPEPGSLLATTFVVLPAASEETLSLVAKVKNWRNLNWRGVGLAAVGSLGFATCYRFCRGTAASQLMPHENAAQSLARSGEDPFLEPKRPVSYPPTFLEPSH